VESGRIRTVPAGYRGQTWARSSWACGPLSGALGTGGPRPVAPGIELLQPGDSEDLDCAIDEVVQMARDDPETLWPIVVRMVAEAPNERHLVTVVPLRWSGAKAAAAVRPGANNGLSPLTTGKSGFEIVGIDVRQGSLPRTACDMGPCPPAVAHLLEQIEYVDIVTLHY
jgi:hypothetical protein